MNDGAVEPCRRAGAGQPTRWLVVTDLDGTLLDDAYDLAAAARAIDRQTRQGRTVALASSKTLDEMRALARLCEQPPVLIFENGAGIAWPDGARRVDPEELPYRIDVAGEGYAALRARLRSLRRRTGFNFLGFGDLSAREVASHTGLSEDGARLARHRCSSEPVLWLDRPESLVSFRDELAGAGYRVVEGGRFHHVMPRTDKAHGLERVAERLGDVRVIACGDACNDLAMLQAADHAVVFPKRDGGYLEVRDASGHDVAVRAAAAGADCWSETVDRVVAHPDEPPSGGVPRRLRRLSRSFSHE